MTTTEVYARASTKAKREAIEKAAMNVIKESAYDEERRSDLIGWLKGVMWHRHYAKLRGGRCRLESNAVRPTSHNVELGILNSGLSRRSGMRTGAVATASLRARQRRRHAITPLY